MTRTYFIIVLLNASLLTMHAQFYNGHQMSFGKNRVQHNDFYWSYYRFEKFDTYFNQDGYPLAQYVADYADKAITRYEKFFDYNLDKRIIFIIYNKLSDFRQGNIGLITGDVDYNIGGVTTISKNKVFIYFEGDYRKFDEQINAAVVKVLMQEMLFGNELKDNLANAALINLPQWYEKGLISYLSNNWDFEIENRVKDGIQSKKFKKFNRLEGDDAKYAGHAFWKYIADTYSESLIPNIVYLTRVNKSANSGFLYVLGLTLRELSQGYKAYYENKFSDLSTEAQLPESGKVLKRSKKQRIYRQVKVNPLGRYMAYVSNDMGKNKIWLHNTTDGKRGKIFRLGHRLEQIPDYSQPVLAWHPSGRILAFITEEKGGLKLYFYTLASKELTVKNLLYFDKILDFSFSEDGTQLVLSAVKEGQTDIFVHNLASQTNEQITNDIYDDFYPRFTNNDKQIIFSSNRSSDTLNNDESKIRDLQHDLFIYEYKKSDENLKHISNKPYVNEYYPEPIATNKFICINDQNGIFNRCLIDFDSTISFIDTTIHYRYYSTYRPLTFYPRNILEQDYNKNTNKVSEVIYNKGKYQIYYNPLEEKPLDIPISFKTDFRERTSKELLKEDSIRGIEIKKIHYEQVQSNVLQIDEDTIRLQEFEIDVNNYIFEKEKINFYNNQLRDRNISLTFDTIPEKEPKIRVYQTAFYQNYLASKIDFNFLNNSYQAFTGGAVYYNPGLNAFFKIGTQDLFEDYKLTGGIRLSTDFSSNEYLLSFENLKKNLDKQIIFHRLTFENNLEEERYTYRIKTYTHNLYFVYRHPFNQVSAWARTINIRHDKTVFKSDPNDPNTLFRGDIHKVWGGVKLEYIFDNTRSLGMNIPAGTRSKLFAEFYQQLNDDFNNLIIVGADFRHYLRIHRNLIWANRFAASKSFGSARLIYYLGSVDNWLNVTPRKHPTFIPLNEIRIDPEINWTYQTLATNMRGFSQNIRNGDAFALINSEIRWPIIKYLVNYPLSSSFLDNFQVVGFFDIGTAWTGVSPWSEQNAYGTDEVVNGPVRIVIDADRDPVVAGYGFGVRSKILGYFIRLDWAWGIENGHVLEDHIFYLSLNLDF